MWNCEVWRSMILGIFRHKQRDDAMPQRGILLTFHSPVTDNDIDFLDMIEGHGQTIAPSWFSNCSVSRDELEEYTKFTRSQLKAYKNLEMQHIIKFIWYWISIAVDDKSHYGITFDYITHY